MSAFVKNCIFIAQQWGDKQVCEKESRNCRTCSYRTIQLDYDSCTWYYRYIPYTLPTDKAICMKMDVYFEIKLLKLE